MIMGIFQIKMFSYNGQWNVHELENFMKKWKIVFPGQLNSSIVSKNMHILKGKIK